MPSLPKSLWVEILVMATIATLWFVSGRIAVDQLMFLRAQSAYGSTTLTFTHSSYVNTGICACHPVMNAIGLPMKSANLTVPPSGPGETEARPFWILNASTPDATQNLLWYQMPARTTLVRVTAGRKQLYESHSADLSAVIPRGLAVRVKSSTQPYFSLAPPDGAETSLSATDSDQADGRNSLHAVSKVRPSSAFTVDQINTSLDAAYDMPDLPLRGVVFDTLGPTVELSLPVKGEAGQQVGVYAGLQPIDIPEGLGRLTIRLETKYAIRFRVTTVGQDWTTQFDNGWQSVSDGSGDFGPRFAPLFSGLDHADRGSYSVRIDAKTPSTSQWEELRRQFSKGKVIEGHPGYGKFEPEEALWIGGQPPPLISPKRSVVVFGSVADLTSTSLEGEIRAAGNHSAFSRGEEVRLNASQAHPLDLGQGQLDSVLTVGGGISQPTIADGYGKAWVRSEPVTVRRWARGFTTFLFGVLAGIVIEEILQYRKPRSP